MSKKYKPYRLINQHELHKLQERFTKNLEKWNNLYALFPLTLALCSNTASTGSNLGFLWADGQKSIAIIKEQPTSIMKHCLFGEGSDSFNQVSNDLFQELLKQLIEISAQRSSDDIDLDEWFYTGAPTLKMTLNGKYDSVDIYLHPEWVLKLLPSPDHTNKSFITNLQDALEPHRLNCHVALLPLSLSLEDMMHLQVGDVIKTEHPLKTPLLLQHQQQTLCQVELGENNPYKSIQVTRPL